MKNTELLALGLAGIALYFIVNKGKSATVSASDGTISKTPAYWGSVTSSAISKDPVSQYMAYAYGRTFL